MVGLPLDALWRHVASFRVIILLMLFFQVRIAYYVVCRMYCKTQHGIQCVQSFEISHSSNEARSFHDPIDSYLPHFPIQIMFIESEELRDKPQEVLANVHDFIGEYALSYASILASKHEIQHTNPTHRISSTYTASEN